MKTRDKILEKGLELMNQAATDAVSTYEIAKDLKIRQSNITYYFPTKTHIVNALFKRMVEEVDQTIEATEAADLSFRTFYQSVERVMKVHQRYQFLLLNYADLITSDPELNEHLIKVLKMRHPEFETMISLLITKDYLQPGIRAQQKPVMLMLNMIGVYWIQEAAIYNADRSESQKRKHYLWLFFQIFIPYLTEKGKKDLFPLFGKR